MKDLESNCRDLPFKLPMNYFAKHEIAAALEPVYLPACWLAIQARIQVDSDPTP
jgi:hypothetical protein